MLKKLSKWCNRGNCTCFFDRVFGVDISEYCRKHDIAYYRQNGRIKADFRFFRRVASKSLPLGIVVYTGVTLFGWYFYNKIAKQRAEREAKRN